MTGWRRSHQKMRVGLRHITHLVRNARWDRQAFLCVQRMDCSGQFNFKLAREYIKELAGMYMVVTRLSTTRADPFLNDRKFRRAHQMPAIFPGTPVIVRRIRG